MDSSNNNNNNNNEEWINNLSSPPSFIQQLPENIKLLIATLFVAIIIHIFITIRQRQHNIINGIDRLRDDLSGRGAVGNCSVDDASGDDAVAIEKDGQVLGSDAQSLEEKPKRRINNIANRNYDALINKIEPNEDDDDEQEEVGEFGGICRGKKKKKSNPKSISEEPSVSSPQPQPEPPQIELKSQANHPGLKGYYQWHSTITSLYRIYAVPFYSYETNNTNNTKYHEAILPMHPSSERGAIPVYIEVVNQTSHPLIDVYWIDHKGNEVHKGSINKGGTWTQTTFIGHPWTFRVGNSHEGEVLLKYVPFRVIPSILGAETTTSDSNEGMQKFILRDVPADHVLQSSENGTGRVFKPVCWVEDSILPEPPLKLQNSNSNSFTTTQITEAIQWSCQQLQREDAIYHGNGIASAKRTLQYLKNICLHPDEPKYRKLRIGNNIFQQQIYNTGARGILLALGFEELYGYLECGPGGGKCVGLERIQQISDAMMIVDQTLKIMQDESHSDIIQPQGGDGYGRAGFGYAGGMNL